MGHPLKSLDNTDLHQWGQIMVFVLFSRPFSFVEVCSSFSHLNHVFQSKATSQTCQIVTLKDQDTTDLEKLESRMNEFSSTFFSL